MNALHPMQTGNNFRNNKRTPTKKKNNPLRKSKVIDYLDPKFLSRFTNDQGKLLPRRITGLSAYQQRQVARAVKFGRHLAIIPFVAQDVS